MARELVVYPQLKWWRPEAMARSALEGSRNCAAAVGAGLANWGATIPLPALITHHDFRVAAGDPKRPDGSPAGLSTDGCLRAYRSYQCDAELHRAESVWGMVEALKAGYGIHLCEHYGTINSRYPEYSGDQRFDGEHSVALITWRHRDPRISNRNSTIVHDPICDGRCRDWGCAPRGPQLIPFRAERLAAGDFRPDGKTAIGQGLATYIVVKPAA